MSCPVCFNAYVPPESTDFASNGEKQLRCLHSVCQSCFSPIRACPTCINNKVSQMGQTAGSAQAQAVRVCEAFTATVREVREMGALNGDEG